MSTPVLWKIHCKCLKKLKERESTTTNKYSWICTWWWVYKLTSSFGCFQVKAESKHGQDHRPPMTLMGRFWQFLMTNWHGGRRDVLHSLEPTNMIHRDRRLPTSGVISLCGGTCPDGSGTAAGTDRWWASAHKRAQTHFTFFTAGRR